MDTLLKQERLFEMVCYSFLYFAEYEEYTDGWIKAFFGITDEEFDYISNYIETHIKKEATQ